MELNKQLYDYIKSESDNITEEWLEQRKKGSGYVYASETDSHTTKQLEENNQSLLNAISKVFISEKVNPTDEMLEWTRRVSEIRVADRTPIHATIEQFNIFKDILWSHIKSFILKEDIHIERALRWGELVNETFDFMTFQFSKHYYDVNIQQMNAQEQLINELSAPVIPITDKEAILPLIGELDSERATHIQRSTLQHCNESQYDTIFIDMSGVQNIDTIVAHHLFQLVQSLDLLGVSTVLCGMNPRVAQIGVQLGIDFSHIKVKSTLSHALESINFNKKINRTFN